MELEEIFLMNKDVILQIVTIKVKYCTVHSVVKDCSIMLERKKKQEFVHCCIYITLYEYEYFYECIY